MTPKYTEDIIIVIIVGSFFVLWFKLNGTFLDIFCTHFIQHNAIESKNDK